MLRTIRYALARRATRWLAVPTLALAAGAALVLSVSAGTVPLGFGTSVASTRGCAANGPRACALQKPSVAATINSLRIAQPAPLKPLPALSVGSLQPASPMTRAAKAREAQIQALKADLFPKVRTTP